MSAALCLRRLPLTFCRLQISATAERKFSFTRWNCEYSDRLYTKKHEWVSVKGNEGTVGISAHAQESLGDVVYVELPEVGLALQKGETAGAIESVKAASDIYAPLTGVVTERNTEVETKPHLINKSTYDKGWLFKLELKDKEELSELMDEDAYGKFCKEEE
jgi:glycine cleavage system H protein